MHSLKEIMESKSVVVIGASRDAEKPGSALLKVLQDAGFQGQVAGVNPNGGEVNGVRLYRNLNEVPFAVDLAVMYIPPRSIPLALSACSEIGVKGVVIGSEGFAERDTEGVKCQEAIRDIFKTTGMRGFGPNTLGIVNTATGLTTSYFSDASMLGRGSIGFISQSGIFVGALLQYLSSSKVFRISKAIGLGNKVDLDEADALDYLAEDEQTRFIAMYLEDIRDGRRFVDAARNAVSRKPVLLLKGGRTLEGARASASHTGSLATDDTILEGVLKQTGVLRMRDLNELISTMKGLACMPLPRGDGIAFVTFSGALSIISVDVCIQEGLGVAQLSPETRKRLSKVIPTPSKAMNPIDIFPDMLLNGFEKTNEEILLALLEDPGVHGIAYLGFPWGVDRYRTGVDAIQKNRTKPVLFSILGARNEMEQFGDFMDDNMIPSYYSPETAMKVLSNMRRYARIRESAAGQRI